MATTAHIINHTHWDREWFLTSTYTTHWVPRLIDKLAELVARNPDFRYLFDGQTLVAEDLLAQYPGYRTRLRALVESGHLTVGPYYCQPDWRLTDGESLIRNLEHGLKDVAALGGRTATGWLVDTFGHISQAPQIHRLFEIETVYVWRGVPQLVPYFHWVGADGSTIFGVDLFGGYRNLYGVTHAPEMALARLEAEVKKLAPYYPTGDLPLFDGYDLEDDPEDPVSFYEAIRAEDETLVLVESTPERYSAAIRARGSEPPTLRGELNSGKYGATFPGTLSARAYLKLMARDCAHLLYRVAEPLAVMARLRGRVYDEASFERWSRQLLQNAVHDCICGVSIDQVHEKMEDLYRRVFSDLEREITAALGAILGDFAPGTYAVSTNPFPTAGYSRVGGRVVPVRTGGVGVWPIDMPAAVDIGSGADIPVTNWPGFTTGISVQADGTVRASAAVLGQLVVTAESGDTYSDEAGAPLGILRPTSAPVVVEQSPLHAVVRFSCALATDEVNIDATVHITLDSTPLLRWRIDLDSRGTDFRVDFVCKTGITGRIHAGMPFDVAARSAIDADLLPRQVSADLAGILLGQRELNGVRTFPFHDFVAVSGEGRTAAVLAQGLRAYQATEDGTIAITLRRAVEWLTKADLRDRVGDAGPFFYVPDARCERKVRHELAVALGEFAPESLTLQQLDEAFQNPPLIVETWGTGTQTEWQLPLDPLPLSALRVRAGAVLARFHNPTSNPRPLSQAVGETDRTGKPFRVVSEIRPKQILTARLPLTLPDENVAPAAPVRLLTPPPWRVGHNGGRPDPAIITRLEANIAALTDSLVALDDLAEAPTEAERLRRQHQRYALQRELAEQRLSHVLNSRKLAQQGPPDAAYLYAVDPEIAALGLELNRLRIKRRIFDYVVAALQSEDV